MCNLQCAMLLRDIFITAWRHAYTVFPTGRASPRLHEPVLNLNLTPFTYVIYHTGDCEIH